MKSHASRPKQNYVRAQDVPTHKSISHQPETNYIQTPQKQKTRVSTRLEAGYSLNYKFWRRERDSNPRYLAVRLISSQVHSTTLPPLLIGSITAFECSEVEEYSRVFCNGKPHL